MVGTAIRRKRGETEEKRVKERGKNSISFFNMEAMGHVNRIVTYELGVEGGGGRGDHAMVGEGSKASLLFFFFT